MSEISLCMIVRNEEQVLGRCLKSAADLVDEIIIVDTGSDDGTKEIARQFTDLVYEFPWRDDFAAARNEAFSYASCEYCMWLDADDVLEEADRAEFRRLKESLGAGIDVVMMPYHTGFDEGGNVIFTYDRERIVRNGVGMRWVGEVHEVIETRGKVVYWDCAVTHRKERVSDPDRNLRIFEGLLARGQDLEPRKQFYYGRELYEHGRYQEALKVLERFLEQGQGWIENNIDACRHCAYCLYRLGQERKALEYFLKTFAYDIPRAEVCCEVGKHFFDRGEWETAAYWYERAIGSPRRDRGGGFVSPDARGYIPCIQLCVCYSRMGREDLAEDWNNRAGEFKPGDSSVLYNRKYFASLSDSIP